MRSTSRPSTNWSTTPLRTASTTSTPRRPMCAAGRRPRRESPSNGIRAKNSSLPRNFPISTLRPIAARPRWRCTATLSGPCRWIISTITCCTESAWAAWSRSAAVTSTTGCSISCSPSAKRDASAIWDSPITATSRCTTTCFRVMRR